MLLLVIICLLLTSCYNDETEGGSSAIVTNSLYGSSNSVSSENASDTSSSTSKFDNNNLITSGIFINTSFISAYKVCPVPQELSSFIFENKAATTASFMINDMELIATDNFDKSITWDDLKYIKDLQERLFNSNDVKTIYAKDYFTFDSTCYSLLKEDIEFLRYNTQWNPLPNNARIRYINYFLDDKLPLQLWENEISLMLKTIYGETSTPVIICESWEFTTNGNNYAYVVASNIVGGDYLVDKTQVSFSEKKCFDDTSCIYYCDVLFCNDTIIYSEFSDIYNVYDDDTELLSNYWSYQTDSSGNLKLCPLPGGVWMELKYMTVSEQPNICVCDVNGDGRVELLCNTFKSPAVREVSIYSLSSENELKYIASIDSNTVTLPYKRVSNWIYY